jgi:drug/metabolite transporter (DMT)-like permease
MITRGFVSGAIALLLSAVSLIGLALWGGHHVRIRNWRFWLGVACLAAASVVGIVGYLQLSDEPRVNHQIPYLASAGMAVVVLSVLGGALIVAEQMRADERQFAELEAAVEALADAVAPAIELPARRAGAGAADD